MTDLSNERLAEMLAGLDGVTSGPWNEGDHWVFVSPASGVTSHALENVLGSDKPQANAAHIARCDPDTMRALLIELKAARLTLNQGVTREMEEAGRSAASTHNSTLADIFEAMLAAAKSEAGRS